QVASSPTSTRPAARSGARMAWDPASQRVILFGGNTGINDVDDTWAWDGTAWSAITISPKPAPRELYALANDPTCGIVIFGGSSESPPKTWVWTGSSWRDATVQPPSAQPAAAAFDSARSTALVVDSDGTTTWESDGESWI